MKPCARCAIGFRSPSAMIRTDWLRTIGNVRNFAGTARCARNLEAEAIRLPPRGAAER